ncbi:serglycin [Oncorhynchus mykiss]|nr:serglycin [Oncorhynchus mykiss]
MGRVWGYSTVRLGVLSEYSHTKVILKSIYCRLLITASKIMKGLNSKICLTLAVIFFLADNGHGAPAKGRYMWLKCSPDAKNANCETQRGPWMDLPGPPDRLPSIAVKDIVPEEAGSEPEEQSGEGSATGILLTEQGSGDQLGSTDVDGIDYPGFVFPPKMTMDQVLPPAQELKEDHLIL